MFIDKDQNWYFSYIFTKKKKTRVTFFLISLMYVFFLWNRYIDLFTVYFFNFQLNNDVLHPTEILTHYWTEIHISARRAISTQQIQIVSSQVEYIVIESEIVFYN